MTIFYNYFFAKILAKYSLKRTKLHHFFNFLGGACPRTPLANACRAMQIPPLFQKNFDPPPPEMKS